MRIKGSYDLNCERERVWDSVTNIDVLSSIIPGSARLKKVRKNKYECMVSRKVKKQRVKVRLKVKTTFELKNINKPKTFRLIAYGVGFKAHCNFRLNQRENFTTVSYEGKVPGGSLGKKVKKALPKLFRKIETQC
ncbi:MAG: SRPBCC domain-containing protein [Anaerolineaceae bacterium]|nr:SRPBCC domain-containing protein [Anaerolineaceae bacterium]